MGSPWITMTEEAFVEVRAGQGILVELKGMLLFSSLAHTLAMALIVLLAVYLPQRKPPVIPVTVVNLVDLPAPVKESRPHKKARPFREALQRRERPKDLFLPKPKEERPLEVEHPGKPSPKAAPTQKPLQPAPEETLKPPSQEKTPAPPTQPKSWSVAQQFPSSPHPGSAHPSALQKFLSSEPAQGSGANPSSTLLAQGPGRTPREEVYRPSGPSRESGPLPREIGGIQEGELKGQGLPQGRRGPVSGIDQLPAGSGSGSLGQVAGGTGGGWGGGHGGKGSGFQGGKTGPGTPGGLGGGGTGIGSYGEGTGFRAPSRPLSIGAPSKGGLGGYGGAGGEGKYIPLNSADPDLSPYLTYLRERIMKVWLTPEGAEVLKGDVGLTFTVERDGSLSKARVITSSGHHILDQGVLDAVNRAAPFRPIPEEVKEKRLSLIGTFSYNQSGASR